MSPNKSSAITRPLGETLTPQGKTLRGAMNDAVVALIVGIVVAVGLIILIIRDISRDGD